MGAQAPEAGLLDIGEVARRTGLAPSALRYYEKEGLIAPAARSGLRRAYDPGVLHRLGVLVCARSAGFTIAEVRAFLTGTPGDGELRGLLAAKAREVDESIGRLERLRDSLAHAAGCDHDPLVECPEFKRAVGRVPGPGEDPCGPDGG
ncbi:MerR family transcriptional regulator [Nocardiopsis suaedae]|uniref:MerR family transcriptional regulator n=1 Tax=Nocardiopsis suaedae TaxID=3018444 RepID=A0ABT4TR69_9ACTN|nr:MerR family transcriptional regulator [Nocardiopsis suaedae]MDA2806764.1 MerR family transcriptional regulator [Nocardiopsis suaedae]